MNNAQCQNCDWSGPLEDLKPIRDYFQRVEPGEVAPAGECPECGCLAHVEETPDVAEFMAGTPKRLEELQAACEAFKEQDDGS